LYGQSVSAPSTYTITASVTEVSLTGMSPTRSSTSTATTLVLAGAGFNAASGVKLVAANGTTTYSATTVTLNTPTQLTATLAAGSVPAGTYSVRVTQADGSSASLPGFTVVQGGTAHLVTNVIVPGSIGNHASAVLY